MKIWERLFGNKDKNITTVGDNPQNAQAPNPVAPKDIEKPYDYGFTELGVGLMSKDYGWLEPTDHKRVILVNPLECKEKISIMDLVARWKGTGHVEWEFLLAGMLVDAVLDAIKKGNEEADITCMFNRDFTASKNRVLTQAQVYERLIKSFDIVEESEDVLKLKFRI